MTTPEVPGLPCFDRDGNPITVEQMAQLRLVDNEYQIVAQDDVLTPDGHTMWVSTVWLGLDHGHGYSPEPVIFETMVFVRGFEGEYCQRYTTEQSAKDGHDEIIRLLHNGVPLEQLGLALRS